VPQLTDRRLSQAHSELHWEVHYGIPAPPGRSFSCPLYSYRMLHSLERIPAKLPYLRSSGLLPFTIRPGSLRTLRLSFAIFIGPNVLVAESFNRRPKPLASVGGSPFRPAEYTGNLWLEQPKHSRIRSPWRRTNPQRRVQSFDENASERAEEAKETGSRLLWRLRRYLGGFLLY
jgi:hypothetical protein